MCHEWYSLSPSGNEFWVGSANCTYWTGFWWRVFTLVKFLLLVMELQITTLIVAPKSSGENSAKQWKTSDTSTAGTYFCN
jgi:hypothetical protein